MEPVVFRKEFALRVRPEDLWPLVSNTGRFNRALGLPSMDVEGKQDRFSQRVKARFYGLTLRWSERPFEWSQPRFFRSVREFQGGPFERFEGGMEVRPEGPGSRVTVDWSFHPRNPLGAFLARYAAGRRLLADAEAMLRRFEASLTSGGDAFPARRTKSPAHADVLAQKAERLHEMPVEKAIAAKLLHLVEHGYDDELSRLRPFELADRWGVDRIETLKVFLHATKAGLLSLRWEVLCPGCSAPSARPASLSELKPTAHCDTCEADFGTHFDKSVEARFSVSPTVRSVETHVFCVGNPAQTPQAAAQLELAARGTREFEVELGQESYVVHSIGAKLRAALRPSAQGPAAIDLDLKAPPAGELTFKPGPVRLRVAGGDGPAVVRVEREAWKSKGATAAIVTTLQDFRDLFSSEVLAPGMEVGVGSVGLLFTDLKDSTALYERIGDATAYALVRDHFGYLFDIVRRRNGAVIKTIGDAVMAAFARPVDALEAALEMQERVRELNEKLAPKPPVVLKIGVHAGPAITINASGVLDYFGTTVNVAARVQNESRGGDVVISESLYGDAQVQAALERHPVASEAATVKLKGLSDSYRLRRLTPHG